jgi:hypothetical protein
MRRPDCPQQRFASIRRSCRQRAHPCRARRVSKVRWRAFALPARAHRSTTEDNSMKRFLNPIKLVAATFLLVLASACANNGALNNDNLAIAAGFKVVTPLKPDQQAILAKLPKDKVTPVNYKGTVYYVLPDSMNNLAYVGGPEQYQAYQQLRVQKQLSNNNLEAAQMNQMNEMDWGGWGGGAVFVGGFRR